MSKGESKGAKNNQSIAVIGCGYWGKNLIRNVSELGCLAAVCDVNEAIAQQFADTYHVQAMTLAQVMADTSIIAVMIASPAEFHAQLVTTALQAGKHVFIEKPLALTVADGAALCQLAQSCQRILMVGHLLQYHAAFLKAKEMVSDGMLGRLQYVYSNRLNLGKFRQEENSLWSFAPHDISMILALAGSEPDRIYATGACHLHPHIEDVTTTHMTFANGIQAHVFVSWLHPFKEQKLVIVGDQGMLVFDDGQPWAEKLMSYSHRVRWVEGMPSPDKAQGQAIDLAESEPLRQECQHFIDCIQSQRQARTHGEEGLRVLKVLDAAQQSMKIGESVSLAKKTEPYFVHESAVVDLGCDIGSGTKIWHFSHLLGGVKLGKRCVIGQNVMIGPDVEVGDDCKIQNNVSLYKGLTLGKGVFCGPSCVFTNVKNPRSEVDQKDNFLQTQVEDGVTIGANATIICGVVLGAYSFIGAGAVVTKDVPAHALMVGNPARQVGWVSHAGECLTKSMICAKTGSQYKEKAGKLVAIEG